jgi:hypothetical protein
MLPGCPLQVRTASCAATACINTFGDEQLAVDVLADKLLFEALRFSVSGCTALACCMLAGICAWTLNSSAVVRAGGWAQSGTILGPAIFGDAEASIVIMIR